MCVCGFVFNHSWYLQVNYDRAVSYKLYSVCVFVQVKVAILKYIETLTLQMDAPDFVNSSETRLAVSRIITWTTEPKSSDVRKVLTLSFIVNLYVAIINKQN